MSVASSAPTTFSSCSPISTLEKQFAAPLGQRIVLLIRAEPTCIVAGGMESVLKHQKQSMMMMATPTNSFASSVTTTPTSSAPSSFNENDAAMMAGGDAADNSNEGGVDDNGDPFNFLSEAPKPGSATASLMMTKKKITPQLQGAHHFLKRVAKNTSQSLERGMTGLAIRADQGRNPDQYTVALYSPAGDLWGITESISVDTNVSMRFTIPLVVPPGLLTHNSVVQLRLYIKSGSAILKSTKVLAKNYLVGSANIPASTLFSQLANDNTNGSNTIALSRIKVPLQSSLVQNASLNVGIMRDPKYPPLCGRGWSLTDPINSNVTNTNSGGWQSMFQPPLDQTYAFALPSTPSLLPALHSSILVGTERSVESTVVLPLATACAKLLADASQVSVQHGQSVHRHLLAKSTIEMPPEQLQQQQQQSNPDDTFTAMGHARCDVGARSVMVAHVAAAGQVMDNNNSPKPIMATFYWQRPDSMFEVELGSGAVPMLQGAAPPQYQQNAPFNKTFYPKICTATNSRLLPSVINAGAAANPPQQAFVGNLRIGVQLETNAAAGGVGGLGGAGGGGGPGGGIGGFSTQVMLEGFVGLDAFWNRTKEIATVPLVDVMTGRPSGYIVVQISVQGNMVTVPSTPPPIVSPQRGLVSLMGMETLMEEMGCQSPLMDCCEEELSSSANNSNVDSQAVARRKSQLATMGEFMTHSYVLYHLNNVRVPAVSVLHDRHVQYHRALVGGPQTAPYDGSGEEALEVHKNKSPRPFRPSSSRKEALLSGIGFNVHIQSLCLSEFHSHQQPGEQPQQQHQQEPRGALFHNVTCGAPADHYQDFGSILGGPSPVGTISGGLRRLESKRLELAKAVTDFQTQLIQAVGTYFAQTRARLANNNSNATAGSGVGSAQAANKHISPRHEEIRRLRTSVIQAMQALHTVTWTCAVRRGNCFSQALGIAISSYLASLSDPTKVTAGWPSVWAQHGYLLTFEGLLSTAGKELGMIEDASVGISMLRMVNVVLVADTGGAPPNVEAVPIPHSPYLRWVHLSVSDGSGSGLNTQYRLEIGIEPNYYAQRIPAPLQNGVPVRIVPLLFQMGVDIRQWGANKGMNVKKTINNSTTAAAASMATNGYNMNGAAAADDDDDDDDAADEEGIPHDDVLIALNYEALRKMNIYAHSISPMRHANAEAQQQQQQLPTHPTLADLQRSIQSSAGKMTHSVLDHAASVTQQLGGGGAVFCKSGKDRTAMQVTFKQAQFVHKYCQAVSPADQRSVGVISESAVFADASTMRVYGTRLPICEKNVGQSKFAFNSLQVQFMPEMLKPPPITLAGFLKGGKVFSREGGIES